MQTQVGIDTTDLEINMRRLETPAPEVNLVPVMNLVTILIPFLLFTSGATAVAVIDADLPGIHPDHTEETGHDTMVLVTNQGLTIVDPTDQKTQLPCSDTCKVARDLDLTGLTNTLRAIRPNTTPSITLTPASGVPYEMLIAVMDAGRDANFTDVTFGNVAQ